MPPAGRSLARYGPPNGTCGYELMIVKTKIYITRGEKPVKTLIRLQTRVLINGKIDDYAYEQIFPVPTHDKDGGVGYLRSIFKADLRKQGVTEPIEWAEIEDETNGCHT